MPSEITDEARRLFAVVVNELWHKHPELVVPGWKDATVYHCGYDGFAEKCWHKAAGKCGYTQVVRSASEDQILAAAALCAEYLLQKSLAVDVSQHLVMELGKPNRTVSKDDPGPPPTHTSLCEIVFSHILAEKGIEHD